jgi:hypothetical protein
MRLRASYLLSALLALQACGSAEHDASPPPKPKLRTVEDLPDSCQPAVSPSKGIPIDDFEDGDELLDEGANLHGVWYVENDGSGEQSPPAGSERSPGALIAEPGAPGSSRYALHTSGKGFGLWGAFVAVKLNASRYAPCPYDVSRYRGVRLAVKGSGSVRVNLGTVSTTPSSDHGECETDTCSDYGATLELEAAWSRHDVQFDELSQPDWATPAEFDPERALRLSFWAEQDDFDFWIDDVRFYE